MEILIGAALNLLDASREALPLMVIYGIIQMQSIKGRLIRVETIIAR